MPAKARDLFHRIASLPALLETAQPASFLGLILLSGDYRRLPEANVRQFRNPLRGLRDRWHAGKVDLQQMTRHVRAWIANAEHANTWRLRQAIFRAVRFGPVRRPDRPPSAFCAAAPGKKPQEPALREPHQEKHH